MQMRLYGVWASMKQRCNNPKSTVYAHYGARGVKVDEPWSWPNGFQFFSEWAIANGYKPGLTLDRINRDGNYCPANCRWVTLRENLSNRRMTPKWKAAIVAMQAKSTTLPRTQVQIEACRRNMAIARKTRHPTN